MSLSSTATKAFASAVHAARVPRDQLTNYLKAGCVPQPKQLLFMGAAREADKPDGPTEIGFGGSRGPGKSWAMAAQIWLDDCQRFPGLKALLLRRTGRSLRESVRDLRLRILHKTPHSYSKSTGDLTFPNGSFVVLRHFRNDRDLDDLIGLEYDLIGVEEATTISAERYKLIRTCCRTSKPGWTPRVYSNANPGGVSHAFYREHFVRCPNTNGVRFIKATYRDNAFLDPRYVETLEALTGWRRAAWLDGDWDVHAGTYFTTFTTDVHVVVPHEVRNLGWTFYLGVDYGWSHPTTFVLFARDNQGDLVGIDDYGASKRHPEVHHKKVLEMLARWGLTQSSIRAFVLGTDAWKPNEKGVTVADTYKKLGWNPKQAKMSRVPGATEVLRRLGDLEEGVEPTIRFFSTCTGLIDQLPTMQCDPNNPEDVWKVDVDDDGFGGDDYYDATRYLLMELAKPREISYGTLSVPR